VSQVRDLLSADINDPLWEAEYDNPAALRRSEPGAEAHLALLEARVYENSFKGTTLEDILRVLVNYGDHVSLQRLSDNAGIPWRGWVRDGTINDSASQLLAACIERKKIDEKPDTKQPKNGRSYRELWRHKETGELLERHVLERGGKTAKNHPHWGEPHDKLCDW
jgi:hypothetical protein